MSQKPKQSDFDKDKVITDEDVDRKAFQKKTKNYLDSKLPKLEKKFVFECQNVSLVVDNLKGNERLPVPNKSITVSNYQAPEYGPKDFEKLHKMMNTRSAGTEQNIKSIKNLTKSWHQIKRLKNQTSNIHGLLKNNQKAREIYEYQGLDFRLKSKFMEFFQTKEVGISVYR